jgi:glyoxylase-like metal-dependent hydrolase (beta-lactamase superfamily II)/rhodanese-related sulfurtransferase
VKIQPFYLTCLAHASYMIESEGVAAVVDPQRDVEIYIEEAKQQGLRIAYVIETHLHADFVSGHTELAARTGATICISARAEAKFPHRAMRDGDKITFGKCELGFLETPGHTPESMCVVVTDLERGAEPWAVLTGDTLFIGDVGRPDLSPGFTAQQLAGMLYDSLHGKLLRLDSGVEVFPAHGAGSLCGRSIGSERSSTIGKEKQFNYALQPMTREAFIEMLTTDLPERPGYFMRDAEINREGAEAMEELKPVPALSPEEAERLTSAAQSAAIVLDTRPSGDYFAAHIPGSVHIPLSGQYASWAGAIIGLDRPIVLLAEDEERLAESRMRLARVGIESVVGSVDGGVEAWQRSGRRVAQSAQVSAVELRNLLAAGSEIQVVDVRRPAEWDAGHIAEAHLKPLNQFSSMLASNGEASKKLLADLDPARPVAVHCKSGYRGAIAASLLERAGFETVASVTGGFDAWEAHALPKIAPGAAVVQESKSTAL